MLQSSLLSRLRHHLLTSNGKRLVQRPSICKVLKCLLTPASLRTSSNNTTRLALLRLVISNNMRKVALHQGSHHTLNPGQPRVSNSTLRGISPPVWLHQSHRASSLHLSRHLLPHRHSKRIKRIRTLRNNKLGNSIKVHTGTPRN